MHFIVIGVLLFVGQQRWAGTPSRESITFAPEDVARLRREWTAQYGSPPSAADESRMIESAVDEAILEREAIRVALDRGDRLVRDRLAKLGRFLALGGEAAHGSELSAPSALGDEDYERRARQLGLERDDPVIRRYLAHLMQIGIAGAPVLPSEAEVRERYESMVGELQPPSRVRLTHIYLARDVHGELLEADAERLLQRLRADGVQPDTALRFGDPFATGAQVGPATDAELTRIFGPDFAAAVDEAPAGRWSGPLRSSYGLHLVWISERSPAAKPDLDAMRGQIVWDLVRQRQEQRLRDGLRDLRRRYRVEVGQSSRQDAKGKDKRPA